MRPQAKTAEVRKSVAVTNAELKSALGAAFSKLVVDAPRSYPWENWRPFVRRPVAVDLDGSYLEVGVRSFGKGTFHKPALSGIEVGSKRLFKVRAGDLVFNIVFAWEGAVAVATSHDDGRVGSHRFLTCVSEPSRATSEFLRFHFLTPEGIHQLGAASPGGARKKPNAWAESAGRNSCSCPIS